MLCSSLWVPARKFRSNPQPYKSVLADLVYADVDDKDYGPTDYKKASILSASERKAVAQAQAQGLPTRPPRETRM